MISSIKREKKKKGTLLQEFRFNKIVVRKTAFRCIMLNKWLKSSYPDNDYFSFGGFR